MTQIHWVAPFVPLDPCLQERPSYGQLDESTSRFHVPTKRDKLKLVKFIITVNYAIPKFSKCKILVGKILMIQHALVKFVRLFHRQSFTLYGTLVVID